jgi:hypothetical protein
MTTLKTEMARRLAAGMLAAALPLTAAAGSGCTARSGAAQASLVELYTSEGCSSCPPADRWLSALARERDPFVIPIAFHVDYWDYLGWKDRYADPRHGRRQRERVAAEGGRVVYTPQVMVDGRSRRDWIGTAARELRTGAAPRASLELAAGPELSVSARLMDTHMATDAELYVALIEDGLSSAVAAGENRGERLVHDAVVRHLEGPIGFDPGGSVRRTLPGALLSHAGPQGSAWVAFVQRRSDGRVLQALRLATGTCATGLRP